MIESPRSAYFSWKTAVASMIVATVLTVVATVVDRRMTAKAA